MAKRQDSGSSSAHQNQRPTSHNEDAIPEMTEDIRDRERGSGPESDDQFENEEEVDEVDVEDEEENEGSF